MGFNCNNCVVCMDIVPKQERERVHFLGERSAKVLVIDYCTNQDFYKTGMGVIEDLLGDIPFTYTSSIRCEYKTLDSQDEIAALGSCSVWTHQLLENRSLIIATLPGLQQMKLVTGHREGEMFVSQQYGGILVIPPLVLFNAKTIEEYRPKVKRMVKHACLDQKTLIV